MPLPEAPEPHIAADRPADPDAVLTRTLRALPLILGLAMMGCGWFLHGHALDTTLFHGFNALGPAAPLFWSCLSVAGLGLSVWIYVGATHAAQGHRVASLFWVIVVGGLGVHFIKHQLGSLRPLAVLGEGAVQVTGEALRTQSLPSGHSAMAFALITLMIAGTRWREPRALLASLGWIALGLGIAVSRMAVGAHWPSDVLFGGGMGVLAATIAPNAWGVAKLTRFVSRPLGCRVAAAGFAVAAVSMALVNTGYPLARPLQYGLAALSLWGAWQWWQAAASVGRRASAASHPDR